MENLSLLERFADVDLLQAMTIGEKLAGSIVVTFRHGRNFLDIGDLMGCYFFDDQST